MILHSNKAGDNGSGGELEESGTGVGGRGRGVAGGCDEG